MSQGPRDVRDILMTVLNAGEYRIVGHLAHSNPPFHSLSLFLTLQRWQHQIHPYILYLYLYHSIHHHHSSPQSPSPHHHHLLLLLLPLLLMQHHLHPAPMQVGCPPLPLTPSVCPIMTLSLSMRSFLFPPYQWQIPIQTMNLPWYDLLHLPYLLMVNPKGDKEGADLGDKEGDDLGDKQGGWHGGKHLHNPACLLYSTVPVSHTMIHGPHISCLHMVILFALFVMPNIG